MIPNKVQDELGQTLSACKQYFIYAGAFSAAVNVLMLTPVLYMLNVYDRVVASGSLSTLAMLTLLMIGLLLTVGGFEWVRSMILIGASNRLELLLKRRVSDATFKRSLLTGGLNTSAQPIADLTALRQFLTGPGLFAFFDAPWFPIYIGVMFMFHPWFGVAGCLSGIIMVGFAFANEALTKSLLVEANSKSNQEASQFQGSLRNAEVVAAMGMNADISRRQNVMHSEVLEKQTAASKRAALVAGMTKSFRLIVQSLLLGLGAFLALNQQISPGMMIAGSLLLGRALAPIDMLVGSWKGFTLARSQYSRLRELLSLIPPSSDRLALPAPEGELSVKQLSIVPPGSKEIVVKGVSFGLQPGESVGIVGPSASGKTTLARAILGIWPAYSGEVRLDGASVASWDREELGPHIGYLPQDIELFEGTIADNICRFKDATPEEIVGAAMLAGVHEMILHLPEGYDTIIGAAGGALSGGQRQRIGLARAVFGNPSLLVLDEPNSNLDDVGEKELIEALHRIKAEGCTTLVITHRTMILQSVEKILVLKQGVAANFGPRDRVLSDLFGPAVIPKTAAN